MARNDKRNEKQEQALDSLGAKRGRRDNEFFLNPRKNLKKGFGCPRGPPFFGQGSPGSCFFLSCQQRLGSKKYLQVDLSSEREREVNGPRKD